MFHGVGERRGRGRVLEIGPAAEDDADITARGVLLFDKRHGDIQRAIVMVLDLYASARANAGKVILLLLAREDIVAAHQSCVAKDVEAPLVGARAVLVGGPNQRRTAQLNRAEKTVVSQSCGLEIAASGVHATSGILLAVDQWLVGHLTLDLAIHLRATFDILGVGDVGATDR